MVFISGVDEPLTTSHTDSSSPMYRLCSKCALLTRSILVLCCSLFLRIPRFPILVFLFHGFLFFPPHLSSLPLSFPFCGLLCSVFCPPVPITKGLGYLLMADTFMFENCSRSFERKRVFWGSPESTDLCLFCFEISKRIQKSSHGQWSSAFSYSHVGF